MNEVSEQRFQIGQKFLSHGKHPRLCTITDVLKTFNSAGLLVRVRYVATHEFIGLNVITDYDVCDATVARGIDALNISLGRKNVERPAKAAEAA